MIVHQSARGTIHRARAEEVYPLLEPGSVSLVISDGPYGMHKAQWDRMKPADLPEWYGPHIEAWGALCAPSATVYVWGTDEGEGYLRAPMRAAGWTFRGSVVWNKMQSPAQIGAAGMAAVLDTTERCGVWTRGSAVVGWLGHCNVWALHVASLAPERLRDSVPTADRNPRAGHRMQPLHPCQKPLAFYDRMIKASSRPGSLVLEPFGGTCRAAIACERLPADEARRYLCIEPDEDGRDYLGAVVASLTTQPDKTGTDSQPSLWDTTADP